MKYKIYLDNNKGYEYLAYLDIDLLFKTLDSLVNAESSAKILVIEHDVANDSDFPVFLYTGNVEKYYEFKEKYENCDKKLTI